MSSGVFCWVRVIRLDCFVKWLGGLGVQLWIYEVAMGCLSAVVRVDQLQSISMFFVPYKRIC